MPVSLSIIQSYSIVVVLLRVDRDGNAIKSRSFSVPLFCFSLCAIFFLLIHLYKSVYEKLKRTISAEAPNRCAQWLKKKCEEKMISIVYEWTIHFLWIFFFLFEQK